MIDDTAPATYFQIQIVFYKFERAAGSAMKIDELPNFIRQAGAITFIIGAGASKSAGIPLAAELAAQINKKYGHCLGELSDADFQSLSVTGWDAPRKGCSSVCAFLLFGDSLGGMPYR